MMDTVIVVVIVIVVINVPRSRGIVVVGEEWWTPIGTVRTGGRCCRGCVLQVVRWWTAVAVVVG